MSHIKTSIWAITRKKLTPVRVNNERLNFPPGTFKIKPGGDGGFSVDSGAVLTYIDSAVTFQLSIILKDVKIVPVQSSFATTRALGFPVFPSMTYHFQGADLTIAQKSSFIVYHIEKYFSLAIAPFGGRSVLGAFQQRNTRFVCDIDSNVLALPPDDYSNFKHNA
ncbi:hypothetical protein Ddye_026883 [Dipteronia dyeriana]|uniref:Xylanase inhibitor C-terminal domain-containing protein n=1 Tax=Dipteronia dyeriana TaxID=168575 RepID=A0AAD9TNH8_9ROSI|nr:hypothetical protein Ddye_026883 [Dipteronia dyeriana]